MIDSFLFFIGMNPARFMTAVFMIVFSVLLIAVFIDASRQKRRAKHRRTKYSRPVRTLRVKPLRPSQTLRVNHSESEDFFNKITHYYNTV